MREVKEDDERLGEQQKRPLTWRVKSAEKNNVDNGRAKSHDSLIITSKATFQVSTPSIIVPLYRLLPFSSSLSTNGLATSPGCT